MVDRGLSEVDLRAMLADARHVTRDAEPGRWIVTARLGRRRWHVILEPEVESRLLVVVTAYPIN